MLLTPLTSNHYTTKDSFSFVEEVFPFDCAHYMTSFDITSQFTNITLKVTISICVDKVWKVTINICVNKRLEIKTKVNNVTKESSLYLLKLATLRLFSFLMENTKCVAMGSPLGRTLTNVFIYHFEEQWMFDCPIDYKHISYSYDEDTFLLSSSELHETKLLNYIKLHQIIESLHLVIF